MDETVESDRGGCPPPEVLEAIGAGMTVDQELAGHIKDCPACSRNLREFRKANALLEEAAGLGRLDSREAEVELPGYDLKREIHRGGQGVVWLAEQQGTRRRVAVKMLLAGRFATSRQRRRFEREIEVVASLDHPSIVTVFESGTFGDGQIYCAMEYVEGVAIDRWGVEQEASVADSVEMIARVAEAVAVAHRRGVIHRDLKPPNVLVDEEGRPRVLDFGLARMENERDTERAELLATEAGEFLGTFTYAAPEQLSGDPALIDTRADVYALGLLLFELVAGERPFARPDSIADLVTLRLGTDAPRLSTRRRGVGRELDQIVARCLDIDPARRYDSAGDLADDLRRLQDGRPVRARGDSLGYLVWKAVDRHRIPAAFILAIVVLVIGSAVSLLVLYRESEDRRIQAERVEGAIVKSFQYLNPAAEGSMRMRLPDLIARLEEIARDELAEEPVVQARVLRLAGDSFCNLEQFDDAERCFLTVESLQGSLAGEPGISTPGTAAAQHDLGRIGWFRAGAARRLADDARSAGRHEEAVAFDRRADLHLAEASDRYRAALAARRVLREVPLEDLAMTMQHLAAVLESAATASEPDPGDPRLDEAETLMQQALLTRLRMDPVPKRLLVTTWNSLARIRSARGMDEAAVAAARKAVDLAESEGTPPAWRGSANAALGRFLVADDRYEEAVGSFERGLEISESVYGGSSGRVLRIRKDLGEILLLLGRPSETLEMVAPALEVVAGTDGDPIVSAMALLEVDALVVLERPSEAVDRIDRWLAAHPTSLEDVRWTRRRERLVDPDVPVFNAIGTIDEFIDRRWKSADPGAVVD